MALFGEFAVNIILIGFMGSGKTVVAKSLSKLMSLPWIEMDDLVYKHTNTKNMHEVFAKGGELLLRETEIAIVKKYASKAGLIISTGGGVVLNKIILDYFKKHNGKVVFLRASFETILKHLQNDTQRPLFQDQAEAKRLFDFRMPLYLSYADKIVDVDHKSPDEVASAIEAWIQS